MTPFLDGIISVDNVADVTLQGLTLCPPVVESTEAFFEALLKRLAGDGFSEAAQILRPPYVSFGVRANAAPRLTIQDCDIILAVESAVGSAQISRGGTL